MAGLGVQAANGATRTELRRVAEISLRCIESSLSGSARQPSLLRGWPDWNPRPGAIRFSSRVMSTARLSEIGS